MQTEALTLSSRSHLPAIREHPQAIVSSMMVLPASVPIPTFTCRQQQVESAQGVYVLCHAPNLSLKRPGICLLPVRLHGSITRAEVKVEIADCRSYKVRCML